MQRIMEIPSSVDHPALLTCSSVRAGPQHVVHSVSVQHEGRVRDVVLPCSLRQGETLLQHGEDGLRHGLRPPRLQRPTLPEPQVVHQALVGVPALLPHGLQLVLVAVCWKERVDELITPWVDAAGVIRPN